MKQNSMTPGNHTNDASAASPLHENGRAIVVLGMHRSGTSMLARLLNLAGAEVPARIIGATVDNVHGHWEPAWLTDRDDELLATLGETWKGWSRLDLSQLAQDDRKSYVSDVRAFLRADYARRDLIMIKEPRLCRFLPLLVDALRAENYQPLILIPFRNPLEVAASLKVRDGMSLRAGVMLWLRHLLDAEADSRSFPRSFVAYQALLQGAASQIDRIGAQLGLTWPVGRDEIDSLLPASIHAESRHNVSDTDDLEALSYTRGMALDLLRALEQLVADPQDADALAVFDAVRLKFDEMTDLTWPGQTELRTELTAARALADTAAEATRRSEELERNLSALQSVQDSYIADLRSRLDERQAMLDQAQATLNQLQSDLQMSETARSNAEARALTEVTQLQSDLQSSKAQAEQALAEMTQLQSDLRSSEARTAESLAETAQLRREFAASQSTHDQVLNALYDTQNYVEVLKNALRDTQNYVEVLKDDISQFQSSRSWRLTQPLRNLRRGAGTVTSKSRRLAGATARKTWHNLPLADSKKQKLKQAVFGSSAGKLLLGRTSIYQTWSDREMTRFAPVLIGGPQSETPTGENGKVQIVSEPFVPKRVLVAPAETTARLICFYLPQYHAIPENDEWWGKGFTEWTNVRPAQPMFPGHYQPQEPVDLGYYDLTDIDAQRRQIELAKLYGIGGFCFYWYWFDGHRLLERPVRQWLDNPELDFPFCVCWANENWTRRWDGKDRDILMGQNHSPEDDVAFIAELAPYLRDKRYIRIDGKPLVLVYRPQLLPEPKATAQRWRDWCRANGVGEIFLAYTQSFESADPAEYGFDAAVEFPPNNASPKVLTDQVAGLDPEFTGIVYDWNSYVDFSRNYSAVDYPLFRSVCPGWDNTARRKKNGAIFLNNTAEAYSVWLSNALTRTLADARTTDERIIFCNAWNEWAEGAHLEPDTRSGYAYLEATRDVLVPDRRPRHVTLIGHDAHPHGAQFLLLNLARTYAALRMGVTIILLEGGELVEEYAKIAQVVTLPDPVSGQEEAIGVLRQLRHEHNEVAIVNTTVPGHVVPLLKEAGYEVVSLVHEMASVYHQMDLKAQMRAIAEHSDNVVFPAQIVQRHFESYLGSAVRRATIRPQGLYLRPKAQPADIRKTLRDELNLAPDAIVLLGVGYLDHRKGGDLFVRALAEARSRGVDAHGVWVGHWDGAFIDEVRNLASELGVADALHLVGRTNEPERYYAAADVFLLTSREDPYPSVVIEAMMLNLPVVMFAGTTGSEDLAMRGLARAVAVEDTAAMAAEAVALARGSADRDRLTDAASTAINAEAGFVDYARDLLALADARIPRVSVIVPSYNYERYIGARLATVIAQDFPIFEIIVLDDCSTDRSPEIIAEIAASSDIPVKFVANEKNSGNVFSQWRKGLELARGDYIWIAEADDLSAPTFLSTVMRGFEAPGVVLSYCESAQIDGDDQPLARDYRYYTDPNHSGRWDKNYVSTGPDEISAGLSVRNTIPNASAVVMRADVLHEVFLCHSDEIAALRFAGDWATYLHIAARGNVAFFATSLNYHRRHQSSVTISNFNEQQLTEIEAMQRLAQYLGHVDDRRLTEARAYVVELEKQFGVRRGESAEKIEGK